MRHLHVTAINSLMYAWLSEDVPCEIGEDDINSDLVAIGVLFLLIPSFCLIENCISFFILTTFNAEYSYIFHMRDIIS